MKVTGKITKICDLVEGADWKKRVFVIETDDQYDNVFAFDVFGAERVDRFDQYNKVGDVVTVDFNVKCREHNGKYYTNLAAWKVFKATAEETAKAPEATAKTEANDDLPF